MLGIFILLPPLQAEPAPPSGDGNVSTPVVEATDAGAAEPSSSQSNRAPSAILGSQPNPGDFVVADLTEFLQPSPSLENAEAEEEELPAPESFTNYLPPQSSPPPATPNILTEVPRQILDRIRTLAPYHRIVYSGRNSNTGARFFVLEETALDGTRGTPAGREQVRFRIFFADPDAGGVQEAVVLSIERYQSDSPYYRRLTFNVLYRTNETEVYRRIEIYPERSNISNRIWVGDMKSDGTLPLRPASSRDRVANGWRAWQWSDVPPEINTTVIPVRERFPGVPVWDWEASLQQQRRMLDEYHERLLNAMPIEVNGTNFPHRSDENPPSAEEAMRTYIFRFFYWEDAIGREEALHMTEAARIRDIPEEERRTVISPANVRRINDMRQAIYNRLERRGVGVRNRGVTQLMTRDRSRTWRHVIYYQILRSDGRTYDTYYWPETPGFRVIR